MARHDLYRLLAALKRQGFASHSDLDDLLVDVHTQYVHVSTKRTITAQHDFAPASAKAPFTIGTNASGQLVVGLNADQLDGSEAADFAAAVHTHAISEVTDLQAALDDNAMEHFLWQ